MGDVIDFRPKDTRVELTLDPQVMIESAIVQLWEHLGGFEMELDEFSYLMCFMAFSDICFVQLEKEQMNVHKDGYMSVQPKILDDLKGLIDGIKTTPPANDQ